MNLLTVLIVRKSPFVCWPATKAAWLMLHGLHCTGLIGNADYMIKVLSG